MLITKIEKIKIQDVSDYVRALDQLQKKMTVANVVFVKVDDENRFFEFTVHGYAEVSESYL